MEYNALRNQCWKFVDKGVSGSRLSFIALIMLGDDYVETKEIYHGIGFILCDR